MVAVGHVDGVDVREGFLDGRDILGSVDDPDRVTDVVDVNDPVEVIVINVDDRGKIKLSAKAAAPAAPAEPAEPV